MSKINRTEVLLRILASAGLISVALLAPNAMQVVAPTITKRWSRQQLYGYRQVIRRLRDRGLIEFRKNKQGIICASITAKGEEELEKYELGKLTIEKPKRWDGKYRIIIFDIKEWKRGIRNELRTWLIDLGFVRLQNSVWVFPYECEEVIALLKSHFKIGKEVLYITADKIENDYWLKKEFDLT